jgi:tetratricopeptide (TPR) repeat protein
MALESMRHGLNHALAERHATTDIDEWHEIALEYGHTYPITAPGELLKTLLVDLYGLQAAIGRYPNGDETQRELRQVGAMLSAFTAQTVANLGYLREARRWWRTARQAADDSEDRYAMLWIRGREVVRAGFEHRPLTAILRLIDEAEARIDVSPPVAALPEFLSGKAQTLALMGQAVSADTETTLIRLRKVFDALPYALRVANDSIFTWGEERLRFTESLAYTYLGDFRRADAAQNQALALYPAGDLRSPAQIELQRALCMAGAGDVLQSIQHAQAIVSGLPAMHRVRPVADLGHKVLRAVPVAEQQRARVEEYRECLGASFTVPVPELTA